MATLVCAPVLTRTLTLVGCSWLMALGSAVAQAPGPDTRAGTGQAPQGELHTLNDVVHAIRGCWKWPAGDAIQSGMDLTIRLSFKASGEIFGARITYQSKVSDEERSVYYAALMDALKLCSPLPVSPSLGQAIAGRPVTFRFTDTRKQRRA